MYPRSCPGINGTCRRRNRALRQPAVVSTALFGSPPLTGPRVPLGRRCEEEGAGGGRGGAGARAVDAEVSLDQWTPRQDGRPRTSSPDDLADLGSLQAEAGHQPPLTKDEGKDPGPSRRGGERLGHASIHGDDTRSHAKLPARTLPQVGQVRLRHEEHRVPERLGPGLQAVRRRGDVVVADGVAAFAQCPSPYWPPMREPALTMFGKMRMPVAWGSTPNSPGPSPP